SLNKEQEIAVQKAHGPSIILAGAGSGKTRVLIQKVLHLIQKHNVKPYSIIMITFTNKAASEMKMRMGEVKLGFIGTFHSFCARVLRIDGEEMGIPRSFVIYDDSDQISLIKKLIKNLHAKFSPSYYLNRISSAKNELISPSKYAEIFKDGTSQVTASIYQKYQKELEKNHALDFDDLIGKTIQLFTTKPQVLEKYHRKYSHFLVDEFQDTNLSQYVLTRLLGQHSNNITIVGDFAQSIYSWRGANIENLNKFQKDFKNVQVFHLERNYRSSQHILDFAFNIISQNTSHPILHLRTENELGDEVTIYEAMDEQEEVLYVTNEIQKRMDESPEASSFAILYRTNVQSRLMEEALLHNSISYVLIGGTRFYERKEVKDVLSYLRLVINPNDELARNRIQKLGKRKWALFEPKLNTLAKNYESKTTDSFIEQLFAQTGYLDMYSIDDPDDFARLENLKELKSVAVQFPSLIEFLEQVALVESEYSENEKRKDQKDGVKLMTLHQAKGLEFDCVFIIGVEDGILPHARSIDDRFAIEEERRLFYVGITRARKKLYISYARRRFIFGSRGTAIRSRFLMQQNDW
ncbi:MAG: UvrD-helicase domain-containing protein, partial [Patescibacteria group bacterium]